MARAKVLPTISVTSQVLLHDTGSSTIDRITNDGTVKLTGRVTGAAGTTVRIYDGTKLLGTATLDGSGGWTFSTKLVTGSHALRAVAVDTSGTSVTSATQPSILVVTAAPVVTITSQKLTQDTGLSASDNVTSNGAVTLAGTVSGSTSTAVQIYDGALWIGTATVDGTGGWSYITTLTDGTHALHAVATDLAGNTATTAAQPAITVDHTVPAVSYRFENQVVGSNSVQLYGNFSGPAGTRIEIFSGTVDLGTATITGADTWTFTSPALAAGNYSFSAVATTLAGATTTFSGVPSLTVGTATGTLDLTRFATVWRQDFTTTQIDRNIFPIVYGNPNQFAYGPDGLTLTSYRADGFGNVGILQGNWGSDMGQGYGLYSVTASHPSNQGAGIAILLWPANNGWPGPELDMVEDWSDPTSQTAYFSVHMKSPLDGSDMVNTIRYAVDLTQMNTFSLDWEHDSLTYYVNGHEIFHLTGSEVPHDFAHGGVNAAFGAQVSDIGSSYQPSDRVSLTVHDMSYATLGPVPPSIRVSNPGIVSHTVPGIQRVSATITGVNLPSSTVYAMVLSANNVAYVDWQAVTLDSNGVGHFMAEFHATGDYLAVTNDPAHQTISSWSAPITLDLAFDPASVLAQTANHDQLWFERSGNDLVVDVLGTPRRTYVDNYYANSQSWEQVLASDGLRIDSGIGSLVLAMASFSAANPAFDPMTTPHQSLNDSYFSTTLAAAVAFTWHP
jgi:hypothetical protein